MIGQPLDGVGRQRLSQEKFHIVPAHGEKHPTLVDDAHFAESHGFFGKLRAQNRADQIHQPPPPGRDHPPPGFVGQSRGPDQFPQIQPGQKPAFLPAELQHQAANPPPQACLGRFSLSVGFRGQAFGEPFEREFPGGPVQSGLVPEMIVHRGHVGPGLSADIRDAGILIPLVREDFAGGRQQPILGFSTIFPFRHVSRLRMKFEVAFQSHT